MGDITVSVSWSGSSCDIHLTVIDRTCLVENALPLARKHYVLPDAISLEMNEAEALFTQELLCILS